MINEGAGCLNDGIVDDPGAIDVGMIFGTGFPPFHGGLLKYADTVGIDVIINELEKLQAKYKSDRFIPSPYLVKLKQSGKKFYN